MSDKVETTGKEREKHIKKDMEEMKKRYGTVNEKLWNLETRMDTMSKEQAEISGTIQSKLDALLRNSLARSNLVADKRPGTRVDFVELQGKKRESPPLPRIDSSIGSGGTRTAMKVPQTRRGHQRTQVPTRVSPDAMTWASTWEMMNRALEAFATSTTYSSERGSGKSEKQFQKTQRNQRRFRCLH